MSLKQSCHHGSYYYNTVQRVIVCLVIQLLEMQIATCLATYCVMSQVVDLKNKLETEKGKDAYPKAGVKLIYAGMCKNEIYMNDNGDDARK